MTEEQIQMQLELMRRNQEAQERWLRLKQREAELELINQYAASALWFQVTMFRFILSI